MSKKVIIMRGIPGSGKSTFLKRYFPEFLISSADNYRMVEGKYVFKAEENEKIHNRCLLDYIYGLRMGMGHVGTGFAVDNTNTKMYEFAPYYRIAEAFGYEPVIVYLPFNPEYAFNRNTHNVPLASIQIMASQMEGIPSRWKQIILTSDVLESYRTNVDQLRSLVFGENK